MLIEGWRAASTGNSLDRYDFHVLFTNYLVRILDNKITGFTKEEHQAALLMAKSTEELPGEPELKALWAGEPSLRKRVA